MQFFALIEVRPSSDNLLDPGLLVKTSRAKPKAALKGGDGPLHKLEEGVFLRTLIDLIPDPILLKDCDGRYVLINRAKLEELAASGFKDVIGKTAFDFFDRAMAEKFKLDD